MLDGKIVSMSPPGVSMGHNYTAFNIASIFRQYLRKKQCKVFPDGNKLILSNKDYAYPDVMVVCDKNKIKWDGIYGAPDLVVEVLSRSTSNKDRGYKKNLYEKHGVKEYWLVNTWDKSIEVYLLKGERYDLDNVYHIYPNYELDSMTDEEKSEIITEFKTSLFDDLIISLDEVFESIL